MKRGSGFLVRGGLCVLVAAVGVGAQEAKDAKPAITAVEPASVVSGTTVDLKIRGFVLKEATEIRFPKASAVKADISEKKDASQPNGLENRLAGDCQMLVKLTLPAELAGGPLEYTVVTPKGEAAGKVMVIDAATVLEEKEPNNGFRETQPLERGKAARGRIEKDKDVDVFAYTAKAGRKLTVRVTGGSGLLMDASVSCYDAAGNVLAAADDGGVETRDAALSLTPAEAGTIFICVSDAHDKGGEWHSYLLNVEEEAK